MMQPDQCNHYLTGGRRMGRDRREYSYALCIPERRSGIERRSGEDRRQSGRIFSMQVPLDTEAVTDSMRA
ncbi:hypothetical protein [Desulfosarcina widdelii]|nr:hypothetical protein [Desulfosarcina widdelii]